MTTAQTCSPAIPAAPPRGLSTKRLSILTAATEVFCREGFSGACIDEIAVEASVSRQTIYNHYRDKEALFVAIVEDIMARTGAGLSAIVSTFPASPSDIDGELEAFAIRLVRNCLCNHDGRFLRKLLQSEGERYPHLFEAWRRKGSGLPVDAISGLFLRLKTTRLLDIEDVDLAARQFLALINADLQVTTLFGGIPTEEDIGSAARNAVKTFLRAYPSPADRA
ncbi:TetR/AcrR family transcriptional regulator [Rhizobium sp. HT1-10]|uniref:TetR/AcrR family transcriptional regulator n=1 Tax=Rhizobium sp. HT1-10 TaxID=3111638 RepID=UPI003C13EA74